MAVEDLELMASVVEDKQLHCIIYRQLRTFMSTSLVAEFGDVFD